MTSEGRTPEQLRQHYEIEKALAARLRGATREERRGLYTALYDELFRRVPSHPQLTRKASPEQAAEQVGRLLRLLGPFLTPQVDFLEVGPGDCALALAVATRVRWVWAVDVSDTITRQRKVPANFQVVLSDGCSVPVPEGSIDVAFSNQLMEHLHPDDAREQLTQLFRALKPGGVYVCITPNRLTGPHDISGYFEDQATGFHLKEYTLSELAMLFQRVGFERVQPWLGGRGRFVPAPLALVRATEALVAAMPAGRRRTFARRPGVAQLLGTVLVGWKPRS